MMAPCSSPGCPNVVPLFVDMPRGRTRTVLCSFHDAEYRPTPVTGSTARDADPLAALRDAMPTLEAVREWNRQVTAVADMFADPHRTHGLVVEVSRRTVTAHQHTALERDQAYVVDLDALTITPAAPKLTDIPFTTERTTP